MSDVEDQGGVFPQGSSNPDVTETKARAGLDEFMSKVNSVQELDPAIYEALNKTLVAFVGTLKLTDAQAITLLSVAATGIAGRSPEGTLVGIMNHEEGIRGLTQLMQDHTGLPAVIFRKASGIRLLG